MIHSHSLERLRNEEGHQLGQDRDAMQLKIKSLCRVHQIQDDGSFQADIFIRLGFVTPAEAAAVKFFLHDTSPT